MRQSIAASQGNPRLVLDNALTMKHATEIESTILNAMRRYPKVEVDLSQVEEIDMFGTHLLGFLDRFSDDGIVIVATSPAVERIFTRFKGRCSGDSVPPARRPDQSARSSRAGNP